MSFRCALRILFLAKRCNSTRHIKSKQQHIDIAVEHAERTEMMQYINYSFCFNKVCLSILNVACLSSNHIFVI